MHKQLKKTNTRTFVKIRQGGQFVRFENSSRGRFSPHLEIRKIDHGLPSVVRLNDVRILEDLLFSALGDLDVLGAGSIT
jgi:hypothetical protein